MKKHLITLISTKGKTQHQVGEEMVGNLNKYEKAKQESNLMKHSITNIKPEEFKKLPLKRQKEILAIRDANGRKVAQAMVDNLNRNVLKDHLKK